jgi:PAS domain S-box-containing protein
MARRKLSVAVIVAATLVTVTTLLFGILATISYVSGHRREEERLRLGVAAQAEELAAALALPVWNIDRAQIDKILDSQAKTPQVEAVIVDAAGRLQARVRDREGRFVASNGDVPAAGLFAAERPITFSGERIGTVRLLATPRYITQQLRTSLISMAMTTLAIDLLLILAVYVVLWRAVVRPLTAIEKYAVAVSRGGTDGPDMLLTGHLPKELASVHSSIETMVRLIGDRYRQLQESSERFHSIFDAVNDAIVINDIDTGAILDANPAMCAMFGYTVEELCSIGIGPLSAGELSFTAADALARIRKAAAGEKQLFEWHSRHKDGHLFWTEVNMHVAAIGDRRRSIVVVRDITQRKRLQDAVERSATEWKETFDTVTTPILIMERSGVVVRVNRAALELSGLSEAEIDGGPIDAIGDGEPWQTASQLLSYIAGERQGTTAEAKDAGGRTWDIIATHFSAPDGGAERFILVLWEITGIVELQETLRRSETLSAMGTLVAGVAHEVRNPLFGISATLDAFDEEMKQPGYAECGATLRQEVNRLVHLMQELLEYGKPAALSIERGDVSEVVGDAVESRRSAARAAQVEIRNAMTAKMPTLLMDPLRLRQVFENLIDNAIQHSDPGMTVHIAGAVVDHAGRHWVECRVEDEGPGFAPQDFDRVFEPFFSQREGGTGLGLSIVQRIVEEHSGKVLAGNRAEGGGSIRVLFPLPDVVSGSKPGAQ